SQLTSAKCLISRLRSDRDRWRTQAQQKERDLTTAERKLRQKNVTIASLNDTNRDFASHLEDATKTGEWLTSKYQTLERKVDIITKKWGDADRTIMRLKKSDRAKGKVTQRNLNLKAILSSKIGTEETLIEALNAACERIQELEDAGEELLDALNRASDESDRSDVEDSSDSGICVASTLEAEVKLRGIVEDDVFRTQKENWSEFL
ncbi:hypothetical protein BDV96DRAFT_478935, partial [Lophiotrema nucula]